jgi:hypothetical protein
MKIDPKGRNYSTTIAKRRLWSYHKHLYDMNIFSYFLQYKIFTGVHFPPIQDLELFCVLLTINFQISW